MSEVAAHRAHRERRTVPRPHARPSSRDVAPADALAHPTWNMGAKITIDSSTLMNKGLEVIEAHELFGVDFDAIDVVVHPQSVVHGMVEFVDGATIAQLSMPDMRCRSASRSARRTGSPRRSAPSTGRRSATLTFEPPDRETFRCLDLAYEAGRTGGTAPAVLSAANEVAVEAFLGGPDRLARDRRNRRRSARRRAPGTPMRSPTFSMQTGSLASGPPPSSTDRSSRVKDPLERASSAAGRGSDTGSRCSSASW